MIGTIVSCFVTMFLTAFFFSAVSLQKIKEADHEAAKWKALADYEAAEKHRALNDLNAERIVKEIDEPTAEEIAAAREIIRQQGGCAGVYCALCPSNNLDCWGEPVAGPGPRILAAARAWLASHGLPVEEPKEAKA